MVKPPLMERKMKKYLLILFLAFMPLVAWAQTSSLPIHPTTTITVSVSNSASSATLVPQASISSWQIELQNSGSVTAFCTFGGSTVSATTSNYPVLAGVDKVVTVDQDHKYISCITASSTTTVYVTGGIGQ